MPSLALKEKATIHIRLRDGQVDDVRLNIYEPPRLFEALLRGRALEDVPDIAGTSAASARSHIK